MPLRPKRKTAGLKACQHGGIDYTELQELGIDPEGVADFSVCTNPFMPPPGIKEIIRDTRIDRYPDSQCTELRQKLSERLGLSMGNILVGSGTTELIRLIAMTYLDNRDCVLLLEPTYGEYEIACRLAGARLVKHYAREEDDFTPKTIEIVNLIRKHHPRAVFICNPNNPTGRYLSHQDVEAILNEMDVDESLLVLDEAYVAFIGKTWDSFALTSRDNVVVLRSMTKDYGLPGLRLGYAVACRDIIDSMWPVLPPWNVNNIAQKAGVAALEKEDYLRQSLHQVRDAKRFLTDELSHLGLKALPSEANYFLVRVGNAQEYRLSLLKHGILVRDCTSFGLPEYIRVSPRTPPECERLIAIIGSILNSGENKV